MKRFSDEHAWVDVAEGTATTGITAYAAEELGDINFVELPDVGSVLAQGELLCVVESVKAASDVFAPVGGTVVAVNKRLDTEPQLINDGAEKDGWICRLEEVDESELDGLMTEEEYELFVAGDDEDGA